MMMVSAVFICPFFSVVCHPNMEMLCLCDLEPRGLFLERPGKLSGPKSYFEIKFSSKVGCVLTSNEIHFVSLAENFTVQFSNLLKLLSKMKTKTA